MKDLEKLFIDELSDIYDAENRLTKALPKMEHYEIASYGCLRAWAEELGHNDALELLKETLSEEKETDERLTELAESSRNIEALHTDEG